MIEPTPMMVPVPMITPSTVRNERSLCSRIVAERQPDCRRTSSAQVHFSALKASIGSSLRGAPRRIDSEEQAHHRPTASRR